MPAKRANKFFLWKYWQRFSDTVVKFTEHIFYKLGYKVGSNPKITIALCFALVALSSLGFFRFHYEKNPIKLWVPPFSSFVKDTEWLISKYQTSFRTEAAMFVGDDVLTPEVLIKLLNVSDQIKTFSFKNNLTWEDICFKIPKVEKSMMRLVEGSKKHQNQKDMSATMNPELYCSFVQGMKNECFEKSLLELWNFNSEKINNLTKDDIIEAINNYDRRDIMNFLKNYEDLLGGIERNSTGHIVAAKSIHNIWLVGVNFSEVDIDKTGNIAGTADWATVDTLDWEEHFLNHMQKISRNKSKSIYYSSQRSFGDLSSASMFQDYDILSIGIVLMTIYVVFVISKFNWLEARVTLACSGLLSVGMSFITACGLCSLFGIFYGPVHTSLPFLLMGLGVDDMFVIMACWDDLSEEQKKLPMPERIGLILKHGGVSISVTSITDILAFLVGSYTILPSLGSFCLYAAIGVLVIYLFSLTFFIACFVLDLERTESRRNGIILCYQHKDYVPNKCSQKQVSNSVFEFIYSKIILTTPGKVVTLIVTVILLGFAIEGAVKLEQRFNLNWFLPQNSYLLKYLNQKSIYFPTDGHEAGIYIGSLNYTHELMNIKEIVNRLERQEKFVTGVESWVEPFRGFVLKNFYIDIYEEILSEELFNSYLTMFLFTPKHVKYQTHFNFEKKLSCEFPAPKIIMSKIDFKFPRFSGPKEYIPAMHSVRDIALSNNFTTGEKFATSWCIMFASWITDEIIDVEVLRNLQLALICVLSCTLLLIANLQTCFWIFICVLLTMVNVIGFMQKWGLTIDMVSCIGLELAIGLCVDYASHVGHTFLTVNEGDRKERALKTITSIGLAVIYGGLSTLIGVMMLSQSDVYIFQSFFKITFLVIIFGLFHGVILLPVILSLVGPEPYNACELEKEQELDEINKIDMNKE